MGKILPILLALVGLGTGVGAGIALRPATTLVTELGPCGDVDAIHSTVAANPTDASPDSVEPDYVKLNNQFVIPVMQDGKVSSLVVISLSLEMSSGGPELVYKMEPKLRDTFLQVMFNHANTGGFDGNFTSGRKMDQLRTALRETAIKTLGSSVANVLIADVVRQDV
ncbi:MAG: flagellar basal body-associated FliL family protein [Paracoccaceae bacterium]